MSFGDSLIYVGVHEQPWLIEVNCSPALGVDCFVDECIKPLLLNDTFELIELEKTSSRNAFQCNAMHLGKRYTLSLRLANSVFGIPQIDVSVLRLRKSQQVLYDQLCLLKMTNIISDNTDRNAVESSQMVDCSLRGTNFEVLFPCTGKMMPSVLTCPQSGQRRNRRWVGDVRKSERRLERRDYYAVRAVIKFS